MVAVVEVTPDDETLLLVLGVVRNKDETTMSEVVAAVNVDLLRHLVSVVVVMY